MSTTSEGFVSPPNELNTEDLVTDATKLNGVNGDSSDEWVQIHDDKIYTPSAADIGHRLRIDVTAYSVADNSVIAGPIALITEPVLAAPRKSGYKRPLHTIPHERTAVSGAIRFRIVSYNVLAEKYATKQVT